MIGFDQAREIIAGAVRPLPAESVPLAEASGRIAAEEIVADADLVPYARSAMDGYALRAADTGGAALGRPIKLPIIGKVLAEEGHATLSPGSALAITTGAPVPRGADAVIPYEEVRRAGEEIEISAPVRPGASVFPPAEDVRRGDVLVRAGETLRPAVVALLAFVGHSEVRVYRRPRVAVVCTGSELVEVSATPAHGQIRNSNAFALSALIEECGGQARFCGTAPDQRDTLRGLLGSARLEADLLITTGGASVGERDLVKGVLAELGTEFCFRSVAVRPGKPVGFGLWDGVPVCVLPGNPAAVFVGFYEFVRPALLRLAGRRAIELPALRAVLTGRVQSKPGRRYIILARLALADGRFEVTPLPNQCSVLVRTSADANALVLLPEGPASFEPGDAVEVQVLDWERVIGVARQDAVVTGAAAARAAAKR